uniref:Uncharacterized protein n=1 Tax=Micrurus paraensis TaxID=1970185 RepID=A0A2D4K8K8_9SAUR
MLLGDFSAELGGISYYEHITIVTKGLPQNWRIIQPCVEFYQNEVNSHSILFFSVSTFQDCFDSCCNSNPSKAAEISTFKKTGKISREKDFSSDIEIVEIQNKKLVLEISIALRI